MIIHCGDSLKEAVESEIRGENEWIYFECNNEFLERLNAFKALSESKPVFYEKYKEERRSEDGEFIDHLETVKWDSFPDI